MYRNFASHERGGNPPYTDTGSGSGSNSVPLGCTTTSTTTAHQEQKYTMASTSQFVPSLNAITTNQDLQWLVQPSLMHPPGPSRSPVPPYPTVAGARPLGLTHSHSHLLRPGVIRASTTTAAVSTRRRNDEHLSHEEYERRKIRRERNKLAAAKCRNRRRELTEALQNETDKLEDEKSCLQKEIAELQKEKDKLELVLEAHRPICKRADSDSESDEQPSVSTLGGIKHEPEDTNSPRPSTKLQLKIEKPKPKITIPNKFAASSSAAVAAESESLHTPVLTSTPSPTPFTAGMVFTYPSAPMDTSASISSHAASHQGKVPQSRNPEPCGIAHRRSSSSGDQSDHSLHSPTILTL